MKDKESKRYKNTQTQTKTDKQKIMKLSTLTVRKALTAKFVVLTKKRLNYLVLE